MRTLYHIPTQSSYIYANADTPEFSAQNYPHPSLDLPFRQKTNSNGDFGNEFTLLLVLDEVR